MVIGSACGSVYHMGPASLIKSSYESRSKITAGPVDSGDAGASPDPHKSKVSSVLLPIYPASAAQKDDVYKGYDKVTTSPTHKYGLPAWNVTEEMKNKYRSPTA